MVAALAATLSSGLAKVSRKARISASNSQGSLDLSRRPSCAGSDKIVGRSISGDVLDAPFPTTAEELFQPLLKANNLPEYAQNYLTLLAESTTSPGAMQKHLLKLACRGAASAAKLTEFMQNPVDAALDNVADSASDLLLKQLSLLQEKNPERRGWKKLRHAVMGASCFKQCVEKGTSKDDSCMPDRQINPVHSKVLSLMLSMIMAGPASAMADAMPMLPHTPSTSAPDTSVSVSRPAPSSDSRFLHSPFMVAPDTKTMTQSFSFHRTPSLRPNAGSGEVFLSAGGMAASTAMKILRSDSKREAVAPAFGDVLSTILDAVSESVDGPTTSAGSALSHNHQRMSARSASDFGPHDSQEISSGTLCIHSEPSSST